MRIRRIGYFVIVLVMAGCGPIQPLEETITAESSPVLASTPSLAISSISPTQAATATPIPPSKVIDKTNLERLVLLRLWDVESLPLFYFTENFWFSDSNQFLVPVSGDSPPMNGWVSFSVERSTPLWFIQAFPYYPTVNEHDQVIINEEGIDIFNRQGEKIRTIRTNEQCDVYSSPSDFILAIPDTSLVVTGVRDSIRDFGPNYADKARVVIWDIENNTCSDLIEQFDGAITSLSASYDGRYISYSFVVTTNVFTTRIFDLKLRKEKCELAGGLEAHFTRQGQLVFYESMDGSISVVSPEDCEVEKKFDVGTEHIYAFSPSPDGELLAGVTDHAILFWDLHSGEKLREIEIGRPNFFIGFSPDGRFLVTAKRIDDLLDKNQLMLWGISEE